MSDALTDGRKLCVINIIHDRNREALAIYAGWSYLARAVLETMENLKQEIGVPRYVGWDNGSEFISFIEIKYTQPDKPIQNGYIERFYHFFRENILDAYYFNGIHQLQKIINDWREDYNYNHSHKSLGNKSPKKYLPTFDIEFKFFIKSGAK